MLSRFKTHIVKIGDTPVGGHYPVRIQSMLNTNTLDTEACIKQSIALIEAGCEYVRITAPGMKEAQNLAEIKKRLHSMGYRVPLIADVHFMPEVAEYCAHFMEKVRINPGNYADKKSFKQKIYTDSDYNAELVRIADRILPLLRICNTYGTALRIGTNHGSLSDRIINRYGDTPKGMVESTMEFLRICRDFGFNNIVVSLKASNPLIMIEANRLLVQQMKTEDLCFPLHLGVTEAGAGEDGRIKSALGIGTLLSEGIGDTIRVSLTENPVNEIPFARLLVNEVRLCSESERQTVHSTDSTIQDTTAAGKNPRIVIKLETLVPTTIKKIFHYNTTTGLYGRNQTSPDAIHFTRSKTFLTFESSVYMWRATGDFAVVSDAGNIGFIGAENLIVEEGPGLPEFLKSLRKTLHSKKKVTPVFLRVRCREKNFDKWLARYTMRFSPLLMQRLIDGFYTDVPSALLPSVVNALFGIMQACRVRISRTEYISCPTCGRTSFDMEATLHCIKEATEHLQGLKIGVMGCIVNGPGEMADADYGYVGTATGKVNLYKGKKAVKKNIDKENALAALIDLLKADGVWKDK